MASNAWEFGWAALGAVGALLLALVTAALAYATWRLAQAATAEARAQTRPVLIPAAKAPGSAPGSPAVNYTSDKNLHVRIENAGPGPALYGRASLEPTGASPHAWSLAALTPGGEIDLVFSQQERQTRWQLLLDYRDMAGRDYASAILIEATPELRFYNVETLEDRSITPHGDVLPQSGVTDFISLRNHPKRWARLRRRFKGQ